MRITRFLRGRSAGLAGPHEAPPGKYKIRSCIQTTEMTADRGAMYKFEDHGSIVKFSFPPYDKLI
ncbi:hypothetical protein M407DRAFT_180339 [Tulasnella calospora MUT 4182]|uniref:Uncharacterized protein n=1 Tax=Tulasnella calospora MUT 4182 TaxID=1051891 RepID=A0A0C3QCN8_9AGAM|nr:hypothetical protein M407DRAFT_180339 [Tulasnella calospora MUT 4182]